MTRHRQIVAAHVPTNAIIVASPSALDVHHHPLAEMTIVILSTVVAAAVGLPNMVVEMIGQPLGEETTETMTVSIPGLGLMSLTTTAMILAGGGALP